MLVEAKVNTPIETIFTNVILFLTIGVFAYILNNICNKKYKNYNFFKDIIAEEIKRKKK